MATNTWEYGWQWRAACRGEVSSLFFAPNYPEPKEEREARERQAKAIEDLKAKGIQFAKMDENAFLETMRPVWQKIAATYKATDLLEAIVKAGQ